MGVLWKQYKLYNQKYLNPKLSKTLADLLLEYWDWEDLEYKIKKAGEQNASIE